jgi:hypothetical protein
MASLVVWAVVATPTEPAPYVIEAFVKLHYTFQDIQLGYWNMVASRDFPFPTILVAMHCRHATLPPVFFSNDDKAELVWRPVGLADLWCLCEEMLKHAEMMIQDVLYVWRGEVLIRGFQPGKRFVPLGLTDAWSFVFDTGSSDRGVQFVRLLRRRVGGVDEPFGVIQRAGPGLFEKPRSVFRQSQSTHRESWCQLAWGCFVGGFEKVALVCRMMSRG